MQKSISAQEHKGKESKMSKVGYKKLIAWHKADELAYQTYIATKNFPREEIYGITSQLRRAQSSSSAYWAKAKPHALEVSLAD